MGAYRLMTTGHPGPSGRQRVASVGVRLAKSALCLAHGAQTSMGAAGLRLG